jgi:riboflavin synthase
MMKNFRILVMFTGIIENTGSIIKAVPNGENLSFWVDSPISNELKIDQSLSHNGVCLTVEEVLNGSHRVTAIQETISKTNVGQWKPGDIINLERCLPFQGRIDGHIVQGHVDAKATCTSITDKDGSWLFQFNYPQSFAHLVIEKGSICLNGISLTAFMVEGNSFAVAIIPYTYEHTNMKSINVGDEVNVEFDIIGKYLSRMMEVQSKTT